MAGLLFEMNSSFLGADRDSDGVDRDSGFGALRRPGMTSAGYQA
jgi:hypothetical protein